MKKKFGRIISLMLASLMFFNSIDMNALAEELVSEEQSAVASETEESETSEQDVAEAYEEASESEISESDDESEDEICESDSSVSDVVSENEASEEDTYVAEDDAISENEESVIDDSISDNYILDSEDDDENSIAISENTISENSASENSVSTNDISISENSISENEITADERVCIYNGDGFTVKYTLMASWDTGYDAVIEIENNSTETIHNWTISYDCNDEYSNMWDGQIISHEQGRYVIKNAVWNQDIEPEETVTFGFVGKNAFVDFPSEYELIGEPVSVSNEDYTIWYELNSDWGAGFQGTIYIKNNTEITIEDWSLEFDFDRNITNIWNAEIVEKDDNHYFVNNLSHNANIGPEQVIAFGFLGTNGSSDDEPYNYKLHSFVLDDTEYIELEDGRIEKNYLLYAVLPMLSLRHENLDTIRLSDDYDGDGLNLAQEYQYDTNPFEVDTDGDGLTDGDEVNIYGTNPILYDTDGDGLSDGTEIGCGLNPNKIDTDDNGVIDGQEITTQNVRLYRLQDYNLEEVGTKPSLSVTGSGDYSQQIYAARQEANQAIYGIDAVVGSAYDFVHEDNLSFESATITYKISPELLGEYSLDDLVIAYFNEETGSIELLETTANLQDGSVSANVNHLSTYVVVSASKFFVDLDVVNYGANIEDAKVDIVFAIDTTGSMWGPIYNVKNNINNFTNSLEFNNIDVRLGLISYKDIYEDGINSTENLGWFLSADAFRSAVEKLQIAGGGDFPESTVDAIYTASRMQYRSGANKYIIVVTDATNKNGIVGNPDVTLSNVLVPYANDYVSVSVVTHEFYYYDYREIVENTNGALMDIGSDFAVTMESLVTKISEDVSNKFWIRLANGQIVALDADPAKGDTSVDTDGDGLADIFELGETVTIRAYNPATKSFIEYEAWTFSSNPTVADTDGDTVCDTIDLYPLSYDYVVTAEDEKTIQFNSGRIWNKTEYTANEYITDDLYNHYGLASVTNIGLSGMLDAAGAVVHELAYETDNAAVLANEQQNFAVEELAYIGLINNEGSKLYLDEKSGDLREEVFQFIYNRESEYFRHKGYIWGEGWEKLGPDDDRTSGYWTGLVLSEADLNFSCRMYTEKDATELYTCLKQAGAVLICVLAIECAPEYLAAEGAMSIAASNVGMASARLAMTTASGSMILAMSAPNVYNSLQMAELLIANKADVIAKYIEDAVDLSIAVEQIRAVALANVKDEATEESEIADSGSVSGNNANNDSNRDDGNDSDDEGGREYGIDVDNLKFSDTVSGHDNRPYQDSKQLINEIINSSEPIQDPQGTNALYWEVDGSFNNSNGIYELLIDPETNTVWHFVYKSN